MTIKKITTELGKEEMDALKERGFDRFIHLYKKIDEIIEVVNKLKCKEK